MIRHRRYPRLLALLIVTATALSVPTSLTAFQYPSLTISSGTTTGSYYAAASAIAKVFNNSSARNGVRLATVASPGSVANIDQVADGKAAFGIAETELLRRATQGVRPWEGKARTGLRAVMGLYVESVTIVAAVDSGIRQVSDLKGKRLSIGAPGSIDNTYAGTLLQMSGLNPGEVVTSEHSTAIAPELLQKGEIDAYLCIVGHPNLTVLEASAGKRKVTLISLDNALIQQVVSHNLLLMAVAIPTNFYPKVEVDGKVPTIGLRAVLFTSADQPEENVYAVVREVLTHLDLFRRQHPILHDLSPRDAARVGVIPLHPGAVRYFKEAGLVP
ncbi:ABC transporter substrate-binding protein [Geoanaerobacter pelophilus]|uniref:ABC transporter substrate-binding protein n=1 Tax=Geoanaerobacter pelophilus TaxID=60036 RepID=A0ABQ0MGT8_9BACT|nr:TAXI family TRAP transporter solute-binding subunit [Geoanaerobacter pelophilus]GAW66149.1 ABC transporter substrate-binding protein [Geoanaerobacter pelophilus]